MATSLSDEDIIIRQDVSDLVELELRREGIPLRAFIANEPDRNYPLLEIVVDIQRQAGRNAFTLQLAVRDYVIIQRNDIVTTATTYGLSQSGSTSTELALLTEIKNQARSLMADFLNDYRAANGGKR
ncbi:MAG: hypothetical protein ACFE0O_07035 [Opitutales bacterium]